MSEKKEQQISNIMDMLEGNYTSSSGVYGVVKKALSKLTLAELSGLYSMLLCEIKIKK